MSKPLQSLKDGVDGYKRRIWSGPQGTLHRFFNAIVSYSPGRGLQERQLYPNVFFGKYGGYRTHLLSVIRQASETYESGGTAVWLSDDPASIACAGACSHGRPGVEGDLHRRRWRRARVARALGLDTVPGAASSAVPAGAVAGRTVLTGLHGDAVWSLKQRPSGVLARKDSTGSELSEFRLRAGFLHVPVPMLAFRLDARIRTIAKSKAMRQWRDSAWPDTPIALRMAEEAGVPRALLESIAQTTHRVETSLEAQSFEQLLARYEAGARM